VLVDHSTTALSTCNFDGRSIVINSAGTSESSIIVLSFWEFSFPTTKVTVLVHIGDTLFFRDDKSWGRLIYDRSWGRWTSIREYFDRGNIVVFGSSSNKGSIIIITFSVFSRVSSKISVLVDDSTTALSTGNFDGRSIVINGAGTSESFIVIFSFWEFSFPTTKVTMLVHIGHTLFLR
jgi:hypothetical protein